MGGGVGGGRGSLKRINQEERTNEPESRVLTKLGKFDNRLLEGEVGLCGVPAVIKGRELSNCIQELQEWLSSPVVDSLCKKAKNNYNGIAHYNIVTLQPFRPMSFLSILR